MTTPRRTTARRVQAVVVGLGIAGSLGTAAVIGLSTTAATDAGGSGPTTGQQPTRVHAAAQTRGEEGDDEGGRTRTTPQVAAPQPAPAAPAGGSHGTTSGS